MKMIALKPNGVAEQYKARAAEVLPVLAHATRLAPTMRAWVNAAAMPLSLKLPEGFKPSYWSIKRLGAMPTYLPTASAVWSKVCPSPIVTTISGGATGSRALKRQTPEKLEGMCRSDHLLSNSLRARGTGSRSQSYTTSSRSPQAGQLNWAWSIARVVRQDGLMHCW